MKNRLTLVTSVRVLKMLFCGAVTVLAACGGGGGPDPGKGRQTQIAAYSFDGDTAATRTGGFETVGNDAITGESCSAAPGTGDAIVELYQYFLGRYPEARGLKYWTELIDSRRMSLEDLEGEIVKSREYRNLEPGDSSQARLYVAPGGSDTADGSSPEKAFLTVQQAATKATPGAIVFVMPGTYNLENKNLVTKVHGRRDDTGEERIRFVSSRKWCAKIDSDHALATWENKADYVDIVGFDITASGSHGILNRASHTRIVGNHVHDVKIAGGCSSGGGAGINNANYAGEDGDIIDNVVHDIGVPGQCGGVQGIYSSSKGGKIFNNIVFHNSAYGIHLWHASNNTIVGNNTVFANGGSPKGGGGIVVGNQLDNPNKKTQLHDTKVINNIVYMNGGYGIRAFCEQRYLDCIGEDNIVANNLVYGNTRGQLNVPAAVKTEATIEKDPEFVDFQANGSGNYRLKSSASPAANSGMAASAPVKDMDQIARPTGRAHDIGAYESY